MSQFQCPGVLLNSVHSFCEISESECLIFQTLFIFYCFSSFVFVTTIRSAHFIRQTTSSLWRRSHFYDIFLTVLFYQNRLIINGFYRDHCHILELFFNRPILYFLTNFMSQNQLTIRRFYRVNGHHFLDFIELFIRQTIILPLQEKRHFYQLYQILFIFSESDFMNMSSKCNLKEKL